MANDSIAKTENVETEVEKLPITYEEDTLANQDDKTTEYSKLLEFFQTAEAKANTFGMIELKKRGDEIVGLYGRVNQRNIVIDNKKGGGIQKRGGHGGFFLSISMGNRFDLDEAKSRLANWACRAKVDDENRAQLHKQLTSWDSGNAITKFFPNAAVDVTSFTPGQSATVQITLNGKVLSKVTNKSLKVAEHLAVVKIFNQPEYRHTYLHCHGRSYALQQQIQNNPEVPNLRELQALVRKNRRGNLQQIYDDATGSNEIIFEVKAGGEDVEQAAKFALSHIENMTLEGTPNSRNKNSKSRKRAAGGKPASGNAQQLDPASNPIGILNHKGMKLDSLPVYDTTACPSGEGFQCTVLFQGQTFSASSTSKKAAKTKVASVAIEGFGGRVALEQM